jgi:hypothetical protein
LLYRLSYPGPSKKEYVDENSLSDWIFSCGIGFAPLNCSSFVMLNVGRPCNVIAWAGSSWLQPRREHVFFVWSISRFAITSKWRDSKFRRNSVPVQALPLNLRNQTRRYSTINRGNNIQTDWIEIVSNFYLTQDGRNRIHLAQNRVQLWADVNTL